MIHNATKETHAPDGSLTMSEMNRRDREWHDAQIVVTRCAHCEWTHEGPAGDAREAWQAHLADAHPEVRPKSRRRAKSRERADAMKTVAARRASASKQELESSTS